MFKNYLFLIIAICIGNALSAQVVFKEQPVNFQPKLAVASCYVTCNGSALFLKRSSISSWNDTWGLPGGKIEKNQTPFEAMLREVFEETGLDISQEQISFLGKVYVRDAQKDFTYYMFTCNLFQKPENISLSDEHIDYEWIEPLKALESLPLVPGEDECIQLIFGSE